MRIFKEGEESILDNASIRGAAVGASIGLGISGVLHAVLRHRHTIYAKAPLTMRLGMVAMVTIGCSATGAEEFMQSARRELAHADPATIRDHTQLSREEKQRQLTEVHERRHPAVQWLSVNKTPLVIAIWASSMVGSIAYSFRDKRVAFDRKLMHARVYAQFITLVALAGAAALAPLEAPVDPDINRQW